MVAISHNLDQLGEDLGRLLQRYARTVEADIDVVLREHSTVLRNDIVTNWPVDTGASRAGWQGPIRVAYAHYEVVNNFDYAPIIEFGGYPGVGPKTVLITATTLPGGIPVAGGIFPSQVAHAPVRRAISAANVNVRLALSRVL